MVSDTKLDIKDRSFPQRALYQIALYKDESSQIFPTNHRAESAMLAVNIAVLLWSTSYFMQSTTLPYLTKELGIDPKTYGYMQTLCAILHLTGAPLVGTLGDRFGSRNAMVLALSFAALMYFMNSMAGSLLLLLLSRFPSVFLHGMQAGQMIATDLSEPKQRTATLGKVGMFHGIGMILGAFIGGVLTEMFNARIASFAACLTASLDILLVLKFIPKETKPFTRLFNNEDMGGEKARTVEPSNISTLISSNPETMFLLLLKAAIAIPSVVYLTMFSMISIHHFHLAADQNGYLSSYFSTITMVVKGVGVSFALKYFNERRLLRWVVLTRLCAYVILIFTRSVWQFCFMCAPIIAGGGAYADIVLIGLITKSVSSSDTGKVLGLNTAFISMVRTVAPTLGSVLLFDIGYSSFGVFGMITSGVVLVFGTTMFTDKRKTSNEIV